MPWGELHWWWQWGEIGPIRWANSWSQKQTRVSRTRKAGLHWPISDH